MEVTVEDDAGPTADAGDDIAVSIGVEVNFDGSGSSDNVGIESYEWGIDGDGDYEKYGPTVSHTFQTVGTQTVTLRVTDAAGNADTDTVQVTVEDTASPTADAGGDKTASIGSEISFDGSGSSDNVGIESYEWDIDGDGDYEKYGPTVSHTFRTAGTNTVTLRVSDAEGNMDTDTVEVAIEDNSPPTATGGEDKSISVGETVSFDGSGSSDNVGIESYEWDVDGDGDYEKSGQSITHTYQATGTQTVTLRVSDATGNTDTDTVEVTVESPDPANFQISNLSAPENATQGDAIDVSANATNDGEQVATQSVAFRLDADDDGFGDDDVVLTREVQLDPEQSTTVTFSDIDTSDLDAGDYDHGVFTDDDSATATITIDAPEPEPADFQVSNLSAPGAATQGENITVSADISNAGGQEATQSVAFGLDTDDDGTLEELTAQDVTLTSDETRTVTFDGIDTGVLAPGDYTHGVSTENDSATATITIDAPEPEPANFQVSNLSAPATATQGDAVDVSTDVTNDGGQGATQSVEFRLDAEGDGFGDDDDVVISQDVQLEPGESTTVEFTGIGTDGLEAGDYAHGVFAENDSETATLSVEEPDDGKGEGPPAIGDFENAPTDPDGDGLYEDVNGDGDFTIVDVQALFANLDDETVQSSLDAFDFNGDETVDVVDVQKLFTEEGT